MASNMWTTLWPQDQTKAGGTGVGQNHIATIGTPGFFTIRKFYTISRPPPQKTKQEKAMLCIDHSFQEIHSKKDKTCASPQPCSHHPPLSPLLPSGLHHIKN